MDVERPPRLWPSLVVAAVVALAGLSVIAWIIGTLFALVRMVIVVGLAVAVIWAVVASRSDR